MCWYSGHGWHLWLRRTVVWHTHACIHAHTHIHTCRHTHSYTHIHTHIRTQEWWQGWECLFSLSQESSHTSVATEGPARNRACVTLWRWVAVTYVLKRGVCDWHYSYGNKLLTDQVGWYPEHNLYSLVNSDPLWTSPVIWKTLGYLCTFETSGRLSSSP